MDKRNKITRKEVKRFQNVIAEGRFSLPIATVYGALVWIAAGLISQNLWLPFLLMVLAVYLMAELNNRNVLLRVRSRMVSCSFIMLVSMNILSLKDWNVALPLLCFVAFLFLIVNVYQNPNAMGVMANAFFFIGLASMVWVHVLVLVPILLLLVFRPMHGMSGKGLSAAILGLALPYWVGSLYLIYIGDYELVVRHFSAIADTSFLFNYKQVTVGMVMNFIFVVVSMSMGMVHFIMTSYQDKIRVRILYRLMIILSFCFMVLIVVVPVMSDKLLPMMVVTVSPLIAHFFTLTSSKMSNYTFITWLVIATLITVYSLCLTSSYNMVLSECL